MRVDHGADAVYLNLTDRVIKALGEQVYVDAEKVKESNKSL